MKGKKSKWKVLFLLLLAINLIVVITIFTLINLPAKDDKIVQEQTVNDGIDFQVKTNKNDLNRLINQYIKKEGLSGPIHYEIYLKDEVELYGSFPAFGKEMELKLTFEPSALKNGDLVLKQKSIELGKMNLPVSYILNFINEKYKTPNWVSIQPNDEMIYVSLQKMKLKSDVKVKAKKFDLENDDISFTLSVPSL